MRPQILFPLFASINSLKGIGTKTAGFLSRLCGERVVDLIWHLPAGLIDRTYCPKLANARPNVICTIKVKVIEHIATQFRKIYPSGLSGLSAASLKILTANGK